MHSSKQPKEWDGNAAILSMSIGSSGIGFSEYFAIDALNFTIAESDLEKEIVICDIGTGVGALPLCAIKRYKNARCIAVDFSNKMIETLQRYLIKSSISNIETRVLDGHQLSGISNSSVNYTFSLFGVIYFRDRVLAMKEMYRILVEGGKTAISSWCSDSSIPLCLQLTMNEILGNDSYWQPSLSLSDPIQFENELKEAGFKDIQIKRVEHSMKLGNTLTLLRILKSNPIYLDCIQFLGDQNIQQFNQLFIKNINSLIDINQQTQHKNINQQSNPIELKSYSFIGIGTK